MMQVVRVVVTEERARCGAYVIIGMCYRYKGCNTNIVSLSISLVINRHILIRRSNIVYHNNVDTIKYVYTTQLT